MPDEKFSFDCPACRKPVMVMASWVGTEVACPHCTKQLTVPAAPAAKRSEITYKPATDNEEPERAGGFSLAKLAMGLLPILIIVFVFIYKPDPYGVPREKLVGLWTTDIKAGGAPAGQTLQLFGDQTFVLTIEGEKMVKDASGAEQPEKWKQEMGGKWSVKSKRLMLEFKGGNFKSRFPENPQRWDINSFEGRLLKVQTSEGEQVYQKR